MPDPELREAVASAQMRSEDLILWGEYLTGEAERLREDARRNRSDSAWARIVTRLRPVAADQWPSAGAW
jgi:hypothetical protein